ncbi:hypothetical protein BGC33_09480 [Bathymodiolus thermophilus thioautotrophic gill symbiont]|uniref:Uncharacterized protein n=1 Tax=Bathymodiolus thermophilus thioautotrophic gill symbiont TaxID=2360 RepID=A0A1J5U6U8_9GAMM|nr:hypothetical protein BGC33_09480 [Bathymodiolus thermophilus thioautotrophic gill symbiont]
MNLYDRSVESAWVGVIELLHNYKILITSMAFLAIALSKLLWEKVIFHWYYQATPKRMACQTAQGNKGVPPFFKSKPKKKAAPSYYFFLYLPFW